jgi:hypothetical protein
VNSNKAKQFIKLNPNSLLTFMTQVSADLKSMENWHDPVLIVGLTASNFLFIWKEADPHWRKISWSSNKKMLIGDFDLNLQGLILCTVQGVCYKATFSKSKIPKASLQVRDG